MSVSLFDRADEKKKGEHRKYEKPFQRYPSCVEFHHRVPVARFLRHRAHVSNSPHNIPVRRDVGTYKGSGEADLIDFISSIVYECRREMEYFFHSRSVPAQGTDAGFLTRAHTQGLGI